MAELIDDAGEVLMRRDPYWPAGIPASYIERRRRLIECGARMADDYRANVQINGRK